MTDLKEMQESFHLRTDRGTIKINFEISKLSGEQRRATDPRRKAKGGYRLSISGYYAGGGGLCLDEFSKYTTGENSLHALISLWRDHHLNDMRAGTDRQRKALVGMLYERGDYYNQACEFLKKCNLLTDRGYTYGTAWLYSELPTNTIQIWERAKARVEQLNAERDAANKARDEAAEDDDVDEVEETTLDRIAEARGIDAELLQSLADHLGVDLDSAADYHEENYNGHFRTGSAFAENLADDLGYLRDAPTTWPYNHIDWESAWNELEGSDYFEIDGHFYRNT